MSLFKGAKFFITVNDLKFLPITKSEIVFVGRSNSGKSSVINTLTCHNRLSYVSKQPGRTQYINFFELKNQLFLVDLPGYGYAAVPEKIRKHWVNLLGEYLKTREQLIGIILIMDIRHPLKDLDKQMLDFISNRNIPVHILLSKSDKLSKQEQNKALKNIQNLLVHWKNEINITIQTFSSLKKIGIEQVENTVNSWIDAIH